MLKTQNYGFNKPELSDSPPDITVMNPNWDTIDKKIKENTDAIAQNSEAIGTVKTEITKMDMSWDKISGKPNSFVPSAHSHTKADIGLGSVQNYGVATQAQVDEGKANNLYVTPLSLAGLKQSVVNGKQAVVNAINDSLGYNSGLTINNKHEEYALWIKNKINLNNLILKKIFFLDENKIWNTQNKISISSINISKESWGKIDLNIIEPCIIYYPKKEFTYKGTLICDVRSIIAPKCIPITPLDTTCSFNILMVTEPTIISMEIYNGYTSNHTRVIYRI